MIFTLTVALLSARSDGFQPELLYFGAFLLDAQALGAAYKLAGGAC